MSEWLMKIIRAEAERLLELAVDDDELRTDLRALAERILAETREPGGTNDSGSPAEVEKSVKPPRELTLGRPCPASSPSGSRVSSTARGHPDHDAGLEALEVRCRAKAVATRAVEERERGVLEERVSPWEWPALDPAIIAWGNSLADAYYWTCGADAASRSLPRLDQLAGSFETVAAGLELFRSEDRRSKGIDRGLQLLAEAQSALRRALQELNMTDPDQEEVYEWVRATAARHRIYLRRYLRADDLADPSGWPSLLSRIEDAGASGRLTPAHRSWLERIRHHQGSIRARGREGKESVQDWSAIIEAVDSLISDGLPPSSRELRELLIPILDSMPDRDDVPSGFRRALREIDRYLATRARATRQEAASEPVAEVKAAARLLAGKGVVLIGGRRRREAEDALKNALGLTSFTWVETREHQSVESFEPLVARPEVAVVLLAIRWSSHAFGDVKAFCDRHGKPLVRLPGGYSPNQVASQVLAQCSQQLSGKTDRPGA